LSHVFKYEEGGIAITSYDLLFELTKILKLWKF
jgi:hypothetical protein